MNNSINNRDKERLNVGIVTLPLKIERNVPLSYFIDVICPLSKDVYVITGKQNIVYKDEAKNIHIYEIERKTRMSTITKIIDYILLHLKISYKLVKLSENVDLWIFYTGGELALPTMAAKLLNKRSVAVLASSAIEISKAKNSTFLMLDLFLSKISYTLSDQLILYSPNLIKQWNLKKYKNKISITHKHFIDFDKFKIKNGFDERDNLVGYIGRSSGEKGVLNFVKAIPEILEERDETKFLMGGDGPLQDKIKKYIGEKNLNDKVKLSGWIPRDELPNHLNELKLLVLPSYTEGLPNIMLEAMACSTPVLATSVGAIPDIIKDGVTGFIMENNSPECIARNVIRALDSPNRKEIAHNARTLVENEFTYEKAVERYRKILDEMG